MRSLLSVLLLLSLRSLLSVCYLLTLYYLLSLRSLLSAWLRGSASVVRPMAGRGSALPCATCCHCPCAPSFIRIYRNARAYKLMRRMVWVIV